MNNSLYFSYVNDVKFQNRIILNNDILKEKLIKFIKFVSKKRDFFISVMNDIADYLRTPY